MEAEQQSTAIFACCDQSNQYLLPRSYYNYEVVV